MAYYYTKKVELTFEEAVEKVKTAVAQEGFGIVTEIDVTAIMKKKLNIDFRNYRILGACNPNFALKAISVENKIGAMLPCNIVIQEHENSDVEISAVNPLETMKTVNSTKLLVFAETVSDALKRIINSI